MPILAESNDSRNLSIHFDSTLLDFPFQVCDRFLSRSLADFLDFGKFLSDTKDGGGYKDLAEIYESSFLNTVVAFSESHKNLSQDYQQRLINLNCPYWTVSCLRKLPKIPLEQFETFLAQVELQAPEAGIISAKQIETIARQFLVKRRLYLSLGQLVLEEDWQFLAEKLQLTEEQLDRVKLEAEVLAQTDPETGEAVLTTDNIVDALDACGITPDPILSSPARFKRQAVLDRAKLEASESSHLQLQQDHSHLQQGYSQLEQSHSQLLQDYSRLEQEIARLRQDKLDRSEPDNRRSTVSSPESVNIERHQFSQPEVYEGELEEKSTSFAQEARNLFVNSETQIERGAENLTRKPLTLFNEEPLKNLPVRIVREGCPVETGKLLGAVPHGIDWQVLLDSEDGSAHQTIGVYKMSEMEVKYPQDAEFQLFFQVLKQVGPNPEVLRFEKEFNEQCFLENPKDFLKTYHPRKRKKAKGFA